MTTSWISQRVTLLSPSFSNNHSGFLCHMTFYIYSKYTIGDIYPSFDAFLLWISAVLKWKTLLPHINFFPKTTIVRCSVQLYFIYSHFKFRSGETFTVAILSPH